MGAKVSRLLFILPSPRRSRPPPSYEARLLPLPILRTCQAQAVFCEYTSTACSAMTTDSSSSSIAASEGSTTRPQAGPLPTKRGEIGYRESLNQPAPPNAELESDVTDDQATLPTRHPADRELPPTPSELGPPPITNAGDNQPPAESQPQPRRDISFFGPRFTKQGVRASTIFLLVTQGSLLLLTIALWIILSELVLPPSGAGLATSVFVHITFLTCTIVQVALFERLFFRYRAERYAMLHPGEVLPDLFNRGEQISTRLALAPWNRPPLPTVRSCRLG